MALNFQSQPASAAEYLPSPGKEASSASQENQLLAEEPLEAGDPMLTKATALLDRYGGVIFTGPPGTSKSYWARRIGTTLVEGDEDRIAFLQFHPAYQYEDFMQGIAPQGDGTFKPVDKPFLQMCRDASEDPQERTYVIVIDELSRADPGRVFGEALTYVEKSKRGVRFQTALDSEKQVQVPANLAILATMNPRDRGVDEVDAAFERRFAKIAMEPDRAIAEQFLEEGGLDEDLRRRVLGFFDDANRRAKKNSLAALGHTFFIDLADKTDLESLWEHQLRFLFEKAYRLNPAELEEIEKIWQRIFRDAT
ncbi:MAG TPA: AAA family ATPase [Solirubrobacterales bacterium]|nr:AAA family ATPase [Solirubrobacterales bacterium]